ncbi:MAG: branched-chain amino acid aminotransferase [Rhizobiaceae bacterium]|nr:branched-chain amino acid aminotransferase [Hyphomicrobiales bacterium]NRB32560.1 branched-chain amino acid aminotransferase [Rhizobiaceae bacterium]
MSEFSETWTYMDDAWHEGNVPVVGAREHAFWLGSSVFDGARAFEGVTPDLDLHCARVNKSAEALGLKPTKTDQEIYDLCREGVAKFDKDAALYIRPMYFATQGGPLAVAALPESTKFLLSIYVTPMPSPTAGLTVTVSPFRRPTQECMPLDAKAGCLYPNNARALVEANSRGFQNAILLDFLGNVAELATANIFMVKDGVVFTPAANGTFLSGITRHRVISLLDEAGYDVRQTTLKIADFEEADEIFSTGNMAKVMPVIKFQERDLQPGPVAAKARDLYWQYAHAIAA